MNQELISPHCLINPFHSPNARLLQGWMVCLRKAEIHYLVCLVLLSPIKCNYAGIEPLLTFSEPCYKLCICEKLLSSQSSLSVIVSEQCLFNPWGAH